MPRRHGKNPTAFERRVWAAVKKIPRGKAATYGAVARAVGRPGAWRAVGNALNKNPFRDVPCHRVVRRNGSAGGYARGTAVKIKLLRGEGVCLRRGKVATSCVLDCL